MALKIIADKNILATSWNIATEPRLYQELAPNPYSAKALRIFSERFPESNIADIIKAVVLAEPEGKYERNFRLLSKVQQEKEISKQKTIEDKINKRLVQYYKKYTKELILLPKELIYHNLSKVIFGTEDFKKTEKEYSQNQRRSFRLSIVDFIENTKKPKTTTWPLLKISFATLLLILFFYVGQKQIQIAAWRPQVKKQIAALVDQKESKELPVRLIIPRINVDAPVKYMGLTSEGAMDVPSNVIDVGWYKLGPIPGEIGSAVIAGHFDGRIAESGVFNNLGRLVQGDKVYVVNAAGTTSVFAVREIRTHAPGYADDVYSSNDNKAHLNLITCDGVWNVTQNSYNKRLIVFADIAN